MFFRDDFFEKEIRCGFEISEMMKRAWAAEIEVLQVIEDVCKKNGLQYFADWGTMLGAVRHQGFIPWDDDIDICLRREEYDKLIQILPQELPRGFVLAGMYAREERLRQAAFVQHLRVIADETLWNFNDYMRYFHGFPYQRIGIDIFPLDYIPMDEEVAELQKMILQYGVGTLKNWDVFRQRGELEARLLQIEEWCGKKLPRNEQIKNSLWRMLDSVCALYHAEEAEEMTDYMFFIESPDYRMRKEWYEGAAELPFESIRVPVPQNYHEALTALYGDYMTPVKYAADHEYPFYGHMEEALMEQIRRVGFTGTADEFCRKMAKGELRV